MAKKGKTNGKEKLLGALPVAEEPVSEGLEFQGNFGAIPQAEVGDEDLYQAVNAQSGMNIPAKVVKAYEQAGWYLKFIRTQISGGQDIANISKYLDRFGGAFISYKELESVDPQYAKTLVQGKLKHANTGENTAVLSVGDTALVRYKKALADRVRQQNSAAQKEYLKQMEVEAQRKGLTVEENSERPDGDYFK